MDLDKTIQYISNTIENIKLSPEETAKGIKTFGKILEDFNKLSDKEKHQFFINAFSNPEIKDGAKEFAMRYPDCIYNKYIPE